VALRGVRRGDARCGASFRVRCCIALGLPLLAWGYLVSCQADEAEAPPELLGPDNPSRGCETACGRVESREPECVHVTDGFGVCVDEPAPATEPTVYPSPVDECDGTTPCESGTCYSVAIYPAGFCTGDSGGGMENRCLSDECASDDDCESGWCAPRGVGKGDEIRGGFIRRCFPASCRANADCSARAGGICAFVAELCVSRYEAVFQGYEPPQLACVYPGGCSDSSECPSTHRCRVQDGEARCVSSSG
jgi:hypothetical protein